ncbi:helix-turn-helix transcriptional regulator [Conexibacter sp. JD483]|uniref:helix-turn-helix domain-containing protein n=1 Tax=unclassified Conexibacter TaxID=2627773 RepID=UPI0027213EA2|nr:MULTISPECIES: helix-turn-helix transcriptional regulator [unclassified Conexibacter]MDO8184640.1 helix-turn-helix transcriptional regulator [Conexibacter sp. CPCC 205706]MDO8197946.1 helix-turn-helix transcriptional regulator [Conexibacter sp. CPCC 205762]MDR9368376.1 helix-turn-helix transcriptional regulator [Conexibacter sp. JD483]
MPFHRTSPSDTAALVEQRIFGCAVRELRARRGLSQEQLGFHSGLHRNYVGAIERGEINPTFRTLLTVAGGLSLPLSEVISLYELRRPEHLTAEGDDA